jgi:uncharacterized protein YfdQ (DUF2303 family)
MSNDAQDFKESLATAFAYQAHEVDIGSHLIVPEKYQLVPLEQFKEKPNRFRATFATHAIADFLAYLEANIDHPLNVEPVVFIDQDKMQAMAIFDFGCPNEARWRQHRALLRLTNTAEFDALEDFEGTVMSQRALLDFLEDYADNIRFVRREESGPVDIGFSQAMAALSNLTTAKKTEAKSVIDNFKNSQSKYDQIEAKTTEGMLPEAFIFDCIPFKDFDHRLSYPCKLRFMLSENDPPTFKFRIIGRDSLQSEKVARFKQDLLDGIGKGCPVYCGSIAD